MNNFPLISIIIPVYNEKDFLEKSLRSVIKQDYPNLEIIIVDDGSTDGSLDIVEKLAKVDSRIRIFRQKNSGVSTARNLGIQKSKGEYVCFMDSDDLIAEDYVSYLYGLLADSDAEIALVPRPLNFSGEKPDKIEYDKDKTTEFWSAEKAASEMLYYHVKESSWGKLFNSKFLRENNLKFETDLKCGEGFNFCTSCLERAKMIAIGWKPIYYYRLDNPNSAMTKFNIELLRNGIVAIRKINQDLVERTPKLVRACEYAFWHTNCDFLNTIVGARQCKKYKVEYREMRKACRSMAWTAFTVPISRKDKIKALGYLISPRITAQVINHFRVRKFTATA